MRDIAIAIFLILCALLIVGALGDDPFGLAATEQVRANAVISSAQIQADAAVRVAEVNASTVGEKIAGAVIVVLLVVVGAVAIALLAGVTMIQLQRDRLTAERYLQAPPQRQQLNRPPSRRPALASRHALALPRRSSGVIVVEAEEVER